jgi:hypothetical protein
MVDLRTHRTGTSAAGAASIGGGRSLSQRRSPAAIGEIALPLDVSTILD